MRVLPSPGLERDAPELLLPSRDDTPVKIDAGVFSPLSRSENRDCVDGPETLWLPTLPLFEASSPSALAYSDAVLPPGLCVPLDMPSPSIGSGIHGSGYCRPCAWFWKTDGCMHGASCHFCHLCSEGELKARRKNKVAMMRLGLATPKFFQDVADISWSSFFGDSLEPEKEESTTCSSTEQEPATSLTAGHAWELQHSDRSPLDPIAPPNTPSYGSTRHGEGSCKPCAWFWKPIGCKSGKDCTYCHLCTDGELKTRKKSKQVAMRLGLVTPKTIANSEQDARYALNLAACI